MQHFLSITKKVMKKKLYLLMISLLFHTHVAHCMQINTISQEVESTDSSLRSAISSIIIGALLGVSIPVCFVCFNVIKKKLHCIMYGTPKLTPDELTKKASSFD